MKKILLITSGFLPLPPVQGGAVQNLTENILIQNEKEKKFHFVCYSYVSNKIDSEAFQKEYSEYRFIRKSKTKNLFYKFLNKISKGTLPTHFLHEVKKDISKRGESYYAVLIENMPTFTIYANKKICKNVILHAHNNWFGNLHQEICNSCKRIITVSDYLKESISSKTNYKKIVTVLNAVDESKFKTKTSTKSLISLRNKLDIALSDIVILYTGKIKPEKGALELIKAFSNTKQKNVKLIMAGSSFSAESKDTDYIKTCKKLCAKDDRIRMTGYIDYREIPIFYHISDIQVVPSQCEDSCPLTVIEGIDSGLAQIVSDSGGIPELVSKQNAIIIERNEKFIDNLTYAINSLVNNHEKLKSMKQASKQRAKHFQNEIFCKKMLSALNANLEDGEK